MVSHLDEVYEKNLTIDIRRNFHELSLDVIMRIAMGQKNSLQFRNNYYPLVSKIFERLADPYYTNLSWILGKNLGNILRHYLILTSKIRNDPFSKLVHIVEDAIKERKLKKFTNEYEEIGREDFIDFFLNIETGEKEVNLSLNEKKFENKNTKISKQLTIDEICGQCLIFLLAGYDTTANTLGCLSHYLVHNLTVQEKLREEIMNICPDGECSYEQLHQLKFADAVIKETLRLCPVAAFACTRVCSENTTLGNYEIEAGTIIHADVLSIHYSKELWGENAEEFVPERWLINNENCVLPQLSWMPFGAGPRLCIGMKLAFLEIKIALVCLLRKYCLVKTKDTKETIDLQGQIVMSPKSIFVKLKQPNEFN